MAIHHQYSVLLVFRQVLLTVYAGAFVEGHAVNF